MHPKAVFLDCWVRGWTDRKYHFSNSPNYYIHENRGKLLKIQISAAVIRPRDQNVPGKSCWSHPRTRGLEGDQRLGGVITSPTCLGPDLVWSQQNYQRLLKPWGTSIPRVSDVATLSRGKAGVKVNVRNIVEIIFYFQFWFSCPSCVSCKYVWLHNSKSYSFLLDYKQWTNYSCSRLSPHPDRMFCAQDAWTDWTVHIFIRTSFIWGAIIPIHFYHSAPTFRFFRCTVCSIKRRGLDTGWEMLRT